MSHEDYTQKRIEHHSQTLIRMANEKMSSEQTAKSRAQMINALKFLGFVVIGALIMIWVIKLI